MSQRATNKTPRRTPSSDPLEKNILCHCLLRDVPENAELIGFPTDANPDSIVFVYGSKRDPPNQLIYASFKEATNFGSFKKYLHKYLIPCYSRPWGKNGFSHIYHGKYDYTVLEEGNLQKVVGKKQRLIEDLEVVEENINTPKKLQRNRKRTHQDDEIQVLPSVSKAQTPEVRIEEDEEEQEKSHTPKRQRIFKSIDETPEKYLFARSEPTIQNCSQTSTLSLIIPGNNNPQHPTDFTPTVEDNQFDLSPDSSHSPTPPLDVNELEEEQFEQIKNAQSLFNVNKSEEKFIQDHMFDARSADLAWGAVGIDPYDAPGFLVQHMKPSFFSTPHNETNPHTLSQSIEIDDEPEEDDDDEMDDHVEVSQPPARRSICSIM